MPAPRRLARQVILYVYHASLIPRPHGLGPGNEATCELEHEDCAGAGAQHEYSLSTTAELWTEVGYSCVSVTTCSLPHPHAQMGAQPEGCSQ